MNVKTKVGFWPENPVEAKVHLGKLVDPSFRICADYEVVKWFLTHPTNRVSYRGWSNCRICGCMNGTEDYERAGFVWPSGYLHYITQHDIRPPQHLIEAAHSEYHKHKGPPPSQADSTVKRYIMVGLEMSRSGNAELKVLASADTLAEGADATRVHFSSTGGLFVWIDRETGLPGTPAA